ncbi:transposase [Streptomyces sp. NBC_00445]|uniref:transposase n=1 Tax=Streptomyces sp. NBC_00445 TaxID=2975745 RepID=UPI003FCD8A6A
MWSGNRARHRLCRIGNRQLNAALHRIAVTQVHYYPDARTCLRRRRDAGNIDTETVRALRRRLSDVATGPSSETPRPAPSKPPSHRLLD